MSFRRKFAILRYTIPSDFVCSIARVYVLGSGTAHASTLGGQTGFAGVYALIVVVGISFRAASHANTIEEHVRRLGSSRIDVVEIKVWVVFVPR